MENKYTISIRLGKRHKDFLKYVSEKESIPMSTIIKLALTDYRKKIGYDKDEY